MTEKLMYLRPDVAFEPLVCRWYGWPLLVAPATFAMMLRNRILPLLESFIDDPEFHQESARNPALRGGAFIDYAGDMSLAQALLERTQADVKPLLALADALVQANDLLLREGNGGSLEPLYERLPPVLHGLVELGYDLNNHPSLRLIEPLLYASECYNPRFQSVLLRSIGESERAFVLSTPLIDAPAAGLLLDAPFSSTIYDDLARAREQGLSPRDFDQLCLRIGQCGGNASSVARYFWDRPPPRRHQPCAPGEVRVRYFGHASLLIEAQGMAILTDPSIGYETGTGIDRYSFADLPDRIDYVLLTHHHQDHVLFEALLQLRHKIGTVVVPRTNGGTLQDPSLRLVLEAAGFASVIELDEMQALRVEGGSITGLPFLGEHCDLHIRGKLGFQVELQGRRTMVLADSNNLDPVLYQRLLPIIGAPEVIFIGMECTGGPMSWLYGDLLPKRLRREHDQARRLSGSDFERARRIVDLFDPRAVLVYAMGAEPWFTHLTSIVYTETSPPIVESDKLVAHCRQQNRIAERMYGKREVLLAHGTVALN
jgi:L-ascorbate metabolism protein UlaG (beta-lactamase superfamily)